VDAGAADGALVGSAVGVDAGAADGALVGSAVGVDAGAADGALVGSAVGVDAGAADGALVGSAVGMTIVVGELVGAGVGFHAHVHKLFAAAHRIESVCWHHSSFTPANTTPSTLTHSACGCALAG